MAHRTKVIVNKREGRCHKCRLTVAMGAGVAVLLEGRINKFTGRPEFTRWLVYCNAHAPNTDQLEAFCPECAAIPATDGVHHDVNCSHKTFRPVGDEVNPDWANNTRITKRDKFRI